MARGNDPRDSITPDAFSVAPDLLGLPLARPWRRAAAMLIDLAAIGLLANARGILFAVVASVFLFWIAFRGRKANVTSKLARGTLGCLGATILFVSITVFWASTVMNEETVLFETGGAGGQGVAVTLGGISDFTALLGAADSAEAAAAAERMVGRLADQGISAEQMRAVLDDATESGDESVTRAIRRAIVAADTAAAAPVPMQLDSLLSAYNAARLAGDSAAEAGLGPTLGVRLARDEMAEREDRIIRLTTRNEGLVAELQRTEQALEEERNKGILQTILGFLDELGLGIGWSGLYFTLLTGLFRGRTPGKRLLGIRVLRLDGSPISYWVAFERFGGYAASLFTGLEGFLRILWDRNRQCLEDKLAETVVIRETRDVKAKLAANAAARSVSAEPWSAGGDARG
jgi:uncharacterized RDD family membrane protein YckC